MRNFQFRFILSVISLASILMIAMPVSAAPVRLNQVVQVINAKPGRAAAGDFSQLRLVNDYLLSDDDDDDDDDKTKTTTTVPQQDDRVITTTRSEIVEDGDCLCEPVPTGGGFPFWTLGFAAIPLLFLVPRGRDRTPTPTLPPPPFTETPTPTLPPPTTSPTPTPTTTPPPTTTPTPPETVPEPMTLLLFGTGLASIGLAARKKFGKKQKADTEN